MKEINLSAFWDLLLRNLRAIVITVAVFAGLFAAYTSIFTDDAYTSRCSMYVMNITEDSAGDTTGISSAGLDASQRMVNEYIVILQSNRVITRVQENLRDAGYTVSVGSIRGALNMTAVSETALLEITATTADPRLSKAMCDALQHSAPAEVNEVMLRIGHVSPVDAADVGTRATPPVMRNGIIGALIGLLLSCGIIVFFYLMDNTIKDEKDLKTRFDVTVLGVVPNFGIDSSKKKAKKRFRRFASKADAQQMKEGGN